MQNSSKKQMEMLLTRVGQGSKIVITGDLKQSDKPGTDNGLADFINRFNHKRENIKNIRHIKLSKEDIKRSKLVEQVTYIYDEDE